VRYLTTPSTCFQFEPRRSGFGVEPSPPGFRIVDLRGDGTLETRVVRVPEAYQPPTAGGGYD
jgi:Icc protein